MGPGSLSEQRGRPDLVGQPAGDGALLLVPAGLQQGCAEWREAPENRPVQGAWRTATG